MPKQSPKTSARQASKHNQNQNCNWNQNDDYWCYDLEDEEEQFFQDVQRAKNERIKQKKEDQELKEEQYRERMKELQRDLEFD